MPSFDIVSEVDMQEMDNAINQVKKEISTRYDFRGTKSEVNLDKTKKEVTIIGDDEMKMNAMKDMITGKVQKRGISLKSIEFGKVESIGGDLQKCVVKIINGISKEKGKEIIKLIKDGGFKAQPQIMDEQVRVTSKSIDELQAVIAHVRANDVGVAVQFINMRS